MVASVRTIAVYVSVVATISKRTNTTSSNNITTRTSFSVRIHSLAFFATRLVFQFRCFCNRCLHFSRIGVRRPFRL